MKAHASHSESRTRSTRPGSSSARSWARFPTCTPRSRRRRRCRSNAASRSSPAASKRRSPTCRSGRRARRSRSCAWQRRSRPSRPSRRTLQPVFPFDDFRRVRSPRRSSEFEQLTGVTVRAADDVMRNLTTDGVTGHADRGPGARRAALRHQPLATVQRSLRRSSIEIRVDADVGGSHRRAAARRIGEVHRAAQRRRRRRSR